LAYLAKKIFFIVFSENISRFWTFEDSFFGKVFFGKKSQNFDIGDGKKSFDNFLGLPSPIPGKWRG